MPPEAVRQPVELERELQAPWQAGGEIVIQSRPNGALEAGRRTAPPVDAAEEQERRAEHFALALRLNLVKAYRVVPYVLPLNDDQIRLLERFALSDAGAVWFREMADDTLRLFNQGYLEVDESLWQAHQAGGPRPRLSHLITGRLSEAGLFAQDAAVFRIHAYDGPGSMAAASSIRMGLAGFRCQFQLSGETVDPFAILSHEFGHSRYGDPWSAGLPLGEARTVERYENPVRVRRGFPPRTVYYLRVDPARPAWSRDPLLARILAWKTYRERGLADMAPVEGLYCECPDAPGSLRDCLTGVTAADVAGASGAAPDECSLRWAAVRVAIPETQAGAGP
ncbi:MAG: hypothetical protein AB1899_06375 [Pseudomonadota bacterium]